MCFEEGGERSSYDGGSERNSIDVRDRLEIVMEQVLSIVWSYIGSDFGGIYK